MIYFVALAWYRVGLEASAENTVNTSVIAHTCHPNSKAFIQRSLNSRRSEFKPSLAGNITAC